MNNVALELGGRAPIINDSYSGVLDWVANNQTYVNVTTTYFTYGSHEEDEFSDSLGHTFQASNFQFADIPDALKQASYGLANSSQGRCETRVQVRFTF